MVGDRWEALGAGLVLGASLVVGCGTQGPLGTIVWESPHTGTHMTVTRKTVVFLATGSPHGAPRRELRAARASRCRRDPRPISLPRFQSQQCEPETAMISSRYK